MAQPVRVLQVVTYMGRGGLETMLMNYYRHINRERVQFDFLTHRDFRADYDDEIEAMGGKLYRLPRLNPLSPAYHSALDAFFREHPEYRVVHSHLDCMAGVPLQHAKKHGVPVRIAHAHSSNQTKDSKYLLKLWYRRNIPQAATQLFACSQTAGRWMFGDRDFRVIPNAIDTGLYAYRRERAAAVRDTFGIQESTLVVGHVGRFDPPKNHPFLLEVFSTLCRRHPDACLLLVGDGPGRQNAEQQAAKLGIASQVRFTGVRSDVPELMQAMDVFVFPSSYEGLGIAMVEAQAAGLPCLMSDRVPEECVVTDLVDVLPLTESPQKWAEKILSIVSRERCDHAAELNAHGYDISKQAQKLEDYYWESGNRERVERV